MQATIKSHDNDFDMLRLRLASKRVDDAVFEQIELEEEAAFPFPLSPYNKYFLAEILACLNAPPLQEMPLSFEKAKKILPLPALYLAVKSGQHVKLIVLTAQAVATLLRLVLGVSSPATAMITAFEASLLEEYLQKLLQVTPKNLVLSPDFNLVLGLDLPQDLRVHFNGLMICLEPCDIIYDVVVAQKEFPREALKKGAHLHFGRVDLTQATLISSLLPPQLAQLKAKGEDIYVTKL
jgi:hypothetical protein